MISSVRALERSGRRIISVGELGFLCILYRPFFIQRMESDVHLQRYSRSWSTMLHEFFFNFCFFLTSSFRKGLITWNCTIQSFAYALNIFTLNNLIIENTVTSVKESSFSKSIARIVRMWYNKLQKRITLRSRFMRNYDQFIVLLEDTCLR